MHELSIATDLVHLVQQHLQYRESAVVRAVGLRIGGLVDLSIDSLKFGYEIACKGTPLADSTLEIETVPVVARCRLCQAESEIVQMRFECGQCHNADVEVVSGMELDLGWIDVDEDDSESNTVNPSQTKTVRSPI